MAGPERYVKSGGTIRKVVRRYVKSGGVIREVQKRYVKSGGVHRLVFQNALNLEISANTTDYNIRTAALAAGWDGTSVVNVIVTETSSSIYLRASTTANRGIYSGAALPVGSTLTIKLLGMVQGKGGNGSNAPGNGAAGGPAIELEMDATIDISAAGARILGGGGGGAAEQGTSSDCGCGKNGCTGHGASWAGGGGGGAGTGAGGLGENGNHGQPGTDVLDTGANGAGGGGTTNGECSHTPGPNGAIGGDWGQAGSNVGIYVGGAAGPAVKRNGHTVTWIGFDANKIKGAIV